MVANIIGCFREMIRFQEPLTKKELIFAYVPVDKIEIPPMQRDLSRKLVKLLAVSLEKRGFLSTVLLVKRGDKLYIVDGMHRLEAFKELGGTEILAFIIENEEIANKLWYGGMLSLNIEKAPNVKEKSKQVFRLYKELYQRKPSDLETEYALDIGLPEYITLGYICEEVDSKFAPGTVKYLVEKVDSFIEKPIKEAFDERRKRGEAVYRLYQVLAEKVGELGLKFQNAKESVLKEALRQLYGAGRGIFIEEDFYSAIDKTIQKVKELKKEDFVIV